jgi:hypothetical protein
MLGRTRIRYIKTDAYIKCHRNIQKQIKPSHVHIPLRKLTTVTVNTLTHGGAHTQHAHCCTLLHTLMHDGMTAAPAGNVQRPTLRFGGSRPRGKKSGKRIPRRPRSRRLSLCVLAYRRCPVTCLPLATHKRAPRSFRGAVPGGRMPLYVSHQHYAMGAPPRNCIAA